MIDPFWYGDENNPITKSQMSTYETCPRQFWLRYVAGISPQPTPAIARGRFFHAVLASSVEQAMEDIGPEVALQIKTRDIEEARKIKALWRGESSYETKWQVPIEDFWARGIWDYVDSQRIYEFKTRLVPNNMLLSCGTEMTLYWMAAEKLWGEEPREFVYVSLTERTRHGLRQYTTRPSEDASKILVSNARNMIRGVRGERFQRHLAAWGNPCKSCTVEPFCLNTGED